MENSETGLAELLTGRWSSRRSAVDSPSRLRESTHAVHLSSKSVSGVVMQHVEVKAKFSSRVGSGLGSPATTHAGPSSSAAYSIFLYVNLSAFAAHSSARAL